MPDMDGFEVVRRLRCDPDLSGVFVAALSGHATGDYRQRAQAGFNAFFAKGGDPSEFLDLINKLLRQ